MWTIYSTDLTPHEERLGYRLKDVATPIPGQTGQFRRVQAVVYVVSQSDLIIKVNLPSDRVAYAHMRYGVLKQLGTVPASASPDWYPIDSFAADPAVAIERANALRPFLVSVDPLPAPT